MTAKIKIGTLEGPYGTFRRDLSTSFAFPQTIDWKLPVFVEIGVNFNPKDPNIAGYQVWWGIGEKYPGGVYGKLSQAIEEAQQIKSSTEIRPVYKSDVVVPPDMYDRIVQQEQR